ncbi:hypothetical protein DFS34DRAFT_605629, partial [Phlyctochytrium arcticum]
MSSVQAIVFAIWAPPFTTNAPVIWPVVSLVLLAFSVLQTNSPVIRLGKLGAPLDKLVRLACSGCLFANVVVRLLPARKISDPTYRDFAIATPPRTCNAPFVVELESVV